MRLQVLVLGLLVVFGQAVAAPPRFRVTEINWLPGRGTLDVSGLNNKNEIVRFNCENQETFSPSNFIWAADKGARPVDYVPTYPNADAINDSGVIIGKAQSTAGNWDSYVAFRAKPNNEPEVLAASYSCAVSLNRKGSAVGIHRDNLPWGEGFYWSETAGQVRIGALFQPHDISNQVMLVGDRFFSDSSSCSVAHVLDLVTGIGQDLVALAEDDCRQGEANAVNDSGVVVGADIFKIGGPIHAFVWDSMKGMQEISPDSIGSSATDINNSGQVVGRQLRGGAFYCDAANELVILNKPSMTVRPMNNPPSRVSASNRTFIVAEVSWSYC